MAETNSSVPRFFVCPYCGGVHKDQLPGICNYCHGPLDPDSREQTKADLGPWFVRDTNRPFAPGMRYETLLRRIKQQRLCATDVVRGPTTSQFWTVARKVPGVSHHFGVCHACQAAVSPEDDACSSCHANFCVTLDRDRLGLNSSESLPPAFVDAPVEEQTVPEHFQIQDRAEIHASQPAESEPPSRMSNNLRRELLAARRRQNTLQWLLGTLILGVVALIVLQEIQSKPEAETSPRVPVQKKDQALDAPDGPTVLPPADLAPPIVLLPSPSQSDFPTASQDQVAENAGMSFEQALEIYQRAVDANRSPIARQGELGALEVELLSLDSTVRSDDQKDWKTLMQLVRQAIKDLQAELRLQPEAAKASFPRNR